MVAKLTVFIVQLCVIKKKETVAVSRCYMYRGTPSMGILLSGDIPLNQDALQGLSCLEKFSLKCALLVHNKLSCM